MDTPKHYRVWRCHSCGHLVARDLIDPIPPASCRHPKGTCSGVYRRHLLWDDIDEPGWKEGQAEAAEISAVHYALMLADRDYAEDHLRRERERRAERVAGLSGEAREKREDDLRRRREMERLEREARA
jgi:hypothetical protein